MRMDDRVKVEAQYEGDPRGETFPSSRDGELERPKDAPK